MKCLRYGSVFMVLSRRVFFRPRRRTNELGWMVSWLGFTIVGLSRQLKL